MSGTLFLDWIKQNKKNMNKPFYSQLWDEMIANKSMQKSIASCKKNQDLYRDHELKIINDHALLFEYKLRKYFDKLKKSDFNDPSGFSEVEKGSSRVKWYHRNRDMLQYYMEYDIGVHSRRDSQLNAFRRWIDVADILLKKHCYEGFVLIAAFLLTQYNPARGELPPQSQSKLDEFSKLTTPIRNFTQLRHYINDRSQSYDLLPMVILSKDLTFFNEFLGEKKLLSSKEIPVGDKIRKECLHKESLIASIMETRGKNTITLPRHLRNAYIRTKKRYKETQEDQAGEIKNLINNQSKASPSRLYTKDLVPSFWSRRCSKSVYFDALFSLDNRSEHALRR